MALRRLLFPTGRGPDRAQSRPVAGTAGRGRAEIDHARSGQAGTGSVIVKVAPPPSVERTLISPPWARITLWTIARPRPVPSGRVVKNGSKIRGRSSGAIPRPRSSISIATWGSPGAAPPSGAPAPGPGAVAAVAARV